MIVERIDANRWKLTREHTGESFIPLTDYTGETRQCVALHVTPRGGHARAAIVTYSDDDHTGNWIPADELPPTACEVVYGWAPKHPTGKTVLPVFRTMDGCWWECGPNPRRCDYDVLKWRPGPTEPPPDEERKKPEPRLHLTL